MGLLGGWGAVLLAAAWGLAVAIGCGAPEPSSEMPFALLGSLEAEAEFRPLMREWVLGSNDYRQQLDGRLHQFTKKFEDDDLAQLARLLLAINALDRGELDRARGYGRDAALGPAGTPRDLGTLVLGAVQRRSGQFDEALSRLEPLLHKMIDPWATALLDEELVAAAIGAKRWQKAINYMEVWLRETPPGAKRAIRGRIEQQLANIQTEDLLEALPGRADEAMKTDDPHSMARLVAAQLATLARLKRDVVLAKKLLRDYRALLGRHGEAVARLAADTTRARVMPRTVGLLLALRNAELRRRSVEVAAGMAFGLEIPGSGARLVTRDGRSTAAEVLTALAELAADGAAVIVGGIDPVHSEIMAGFAGHNQLPVILLTPPPPSSPAAPPVFVLGEDDGRTAKMLVQQLLSAGAKNIAGFGKHDRQGTQGNSAVGTVMELPCGGQVPPLHDLRKARVDGVVIYDGADCSQGVLDVAQMLRAKVGVGLAVAPLAGRVPSSARELTAGVFPVDPAKPAQSVEKYASSGRGVPSWWVALGRDAAILSWHAVAGLPELETDVAQQVTARRQQANGRLAAAEVVLWTTTADGFSGGGRIPREIAIRRGSGKKR